MIYIIADTHFGDDNIKIFENRKVSDNEIIDRWNEVINEDDTIYVLGDFAISNKRYVSEILERLKGYKILVKGNHDCLSYKDYLHAGFDEVYFHPIIVDDFWIMSHEPLYMNNSMPYANIFGHVHANPIYKDYSNHHFCVCVERINYTPIPFDDIKGIVTSQV